jgi:hypothetical protein
MRSANAPPGMSYSALSSIGDAIDATRDFLFPVDRSRWLRLAVYAFFLGATSFGSTPNLPGNLGGGGETPGGGTVGDIGRLAPELGAVVVAAILLVVVLALAFRYLTAVTEFAFVEALRDETVSVRAQFRRNLGRGLRLFGFQVLLFGGVVAIVLGPLGLLFAIEGGAALVLLVVAIPVFFLAMFVVGIVNRLTTDFVVPTMLVEDESLLGGWRRLWPVLRSNLAETAVYVVILYVLQFAIGIGVVVVLGVIALVLGLPLAAVGFAVYAAAGGTLGLAVGSVIAVLALVFVALLFVAGLAIQIPVQTFYRYFELFVLGDLDADLDLIPEARDAVRAED